MIEVVLNVGSRYPVDRKKIREFVKTILHKRSIFDVTIGIQVVGERKIKILNEKYLQHQGVTDVLSFPQYDRGSVADFESTLDPTPQINDHGAFILPPSPQRNLGDIVVCFPEVIRQAMKRGKMVDDHICSLIEHGLSHLLGEHHE